MVARKHTPKLPVPSEHESQVAFFTRVRLDPRTKHLPIFAIPNGGARHIAVARKLKAEGVKAGVPDIFVAVPGQRLRDLPPCGLFIEMKRRPNKLTPEQVGWLTLLNRIGYNVATCYSADEAWNALSDYLQLESK